MTLDNHMYICSRKCQLSSLPFSNIDNIDFTCAIQGDGEYPCTICERDCLDGMNCFMCDVCEKWFHSECRYEDDDAYDVILDNCYEAICSERCYMSLLPFNRIRFGTLVKSGIFIDHNQVNHPLSNKETKTAVPRSDNSSK